MARDTFGANVELIAARFADESVGAIDHLTNAKALALTESKVREAIASRLAEGYVLRNVAPLTGYGSTATDYVLLFEFQRSSDKRDGDADADADAQYLRVPVSLLGRHVGGIELIDRPELAKQAVPFAVAVPSKSYEAVTTSDLLEVIHQRERKFMRSLGLIDLVRLRDGGGWTSEGENTFKDTSYNTQNTTTTTYETTINSGHTPDTITDWRQDPDTQVDYRIDGDVDPGSKRGITVPGDRPTLVFPRPRGDGPRPKPMPSGPRPIRRAGSKLSGRPQKGPKAAD